MKLTKENIYINLQGKSKEELTELYDFLKSLNYDVDPLESFFNSSYLHFNIPNFIWWTFNTWSNGKPTKQEVTIQQLKEILQPMEKFTPIAMKCTEEQFEAIKPKFKGFNMSSLENFNDACYLINNRFNMMNNITNYRNPDKEEFNVHETWNEEIFLKSCGIEVDTLEQQLEKAEAEVKRLKEAIEDSKIKVGDIVFNYIGYFFKVRDYHNISAVSKDYKKITDQELINKLNELIK